jgi:penicillin-binding protein 1B
MARRSRKSSSGNPSLAARIRGVVLRIAAIGFVVGVVYFGILAYTVGSQFEGRRWDLPAQVYAAPLELYAGRALAAEDLVGELKRLGYHEDPRLPTPGTYRVGLNRIEIATRGFAFGGDSEPERLVRLGFSSGQLV